MVHSIHKVPLPPDHPLRKVQEQLDLIGSLTYRMPEDLVSASAFVFEIKQRVAVMEKLLESKNGNI